MKYYILLAFWVALQFSCNKFLDIDPPLTEVETKRVFSDNNTATAAVSGLYAQMISGSNNFFSGAMSSYPSLSSDELSNPSNSTTYAPYQKNELLSTTTNLSALWRAAYTYIYQANSILESLKESSGLSQTAKDTLRGEMLFARSILYFYLVNVWGDVPLVTTSSYTENATLSRTPIAEVYTQIENDLLEAKNFLKNNERTNTNSRPGKWAVTSLLARVYLYREKWQEAFVQSSEVINSKVYSLEANLNAVFVSTSKETIWQLVRANANTAEGALFNPSSTSSIPTFCATEYTLAAFEATDGRKAAWLKANTVSGKQYFYPYKYKIRNSTAISEYYVVLRLAEQYLINAEAAAKLNDLETSAAALNIIRRRAGIPVVSATTKDTILVAIAKERQAELVAEWGHRWFDLKRTGKVDEVLSIRKGSGWQSTDRLYPIPNAEILKNAALIQNPGYNN